MSAQTLTIAPSSASLVKSAPRILKVSFGNGYEQRALDGINPNPKTWELVWNNISLTVGGTLDTVFKNAGGVDLITWTQPAPYAAEGAKTFVCEEWGLTYLGGLVCQVTATLMERPNL